MRLNRYIRKYTTRKFKGKRRFVSLYDGPFHNRRITLSLSCTKTLTFTVKGQTGYYEGLHDMTWREV
jgi:hypothetical protein